MRAEIADSEKRLKSISNKMHCQKNFSILFRLNQEQADFVGGCNCLKLKRSKSISNSKIESAGPKKCPQVLLSN